MSQTTTATALDYLQVRDTIRNGDVLLYRGEGIASLVIRKLTRSRYSHAGIAAWWNDRLMVMEVVRKGVVVTTLSHNVSRYHGGVEWYAYHRPIPEKLRIAMVRHAQLKLGHNYNFLQLAFIFIKIVFKKVLRMKGVSDDRVICSQYVAEIYASIGRGLNDNITSPFVVPEDIASSKKMVLKGVLKHS